MVQTNKYSIGRQLPEDLILLLSNYFNLIRNSLLFIFILVELLKSSDDIVDIRINRKRSEKAKIIDKKMSAAANNLGIVNFMEALVERHQEKCQILKKKVIETRKEAKKLEHENKKQIEKITDLSKKLSDKLGTKPCINQLKTPLRKTQAEYATSEEEIDASRIKNMIKSFHDEIQWSDRPLALEKVVDPTGNKEVDKVFMMTCPECNIPMRITMAKEGLTNITDYSIIYYKQHVMWMHPNTIAKKV